MCDSKLAYEMTSENGKRAVASLQWKGTKVCLDFVCECGTRGHLDSYFAYVVMCPMCGRKYGLINSLSLLDLSPGAELGKVIQAEVDVGEQGKWLTYWEDSPKLISHIACTLCGDVNSQWREICIKQATSVDYPEYTWQLICMNEHRILGWPDELPEWLTDEVIRSGQAT